MPTASNASEHGPRPSWMVAVVVMATAALMVVASGHAHAGQGTRKNQESRAAVGASAARCVGKSRVARRPATRTRRWLEGRRCMKPGRPGCSQGTPTTTTTMAVWPSQVPGERRHPGGCDGDTPVTTAAPPVPVTPDGQSAVTTTTAPPACGDVSNEPARDGERQQSGATTTRPADACAGPPVALPPGWPPAFPWLPDFPPTTAPPPVCDPDVTTTTNTTTTVPGSRTRSGHSPEATPGCGGDAASASTTTTTTIPAAPHWRQEGTR